MNRVRRFQGSEMREKDQESRGNDENSSVPQEHGVGGHVRSGTKKTGERAQWWDLKPVAHLATACRPVVGLSARGAEWAAEMRKIKVRGRSAVGARRPGGQALNGMETGKRVYKATPVRSEEKGNGEIKKNKERNAEQSLFAC